MANKILTGLAAAGALAAVTTESNGAVMLVASNSEFIANGLQGAVISPVTGFNSISDDGFRYTKATSAGTSAINGGLTSSATDAGFHSSDAYWLQDGGSTSLTDLATGGSLGGFNAPSFGVGNTIGDYVAVGNSATGTIDLRPVNNLGTIAHSLGISADITTAVGGSANFTGLGTYLGVGGNPNNPFDYVAGITTNTGSIFEMTLGDMNNWRQVNANLNDLQDIAYGNVNGLDSYLAVSDIGNIGLAGEANTGLYNNPMAAIPEPSSTGLVGLGLVAGLLLRRRENKADTNYKTE